MTCKISCNFPNGKPNFDKFAENNIIERNYLIVKLANLSYKKFILNAKANNC